MFYFCNHDSNLLENTIKLLHDVPSVRYKASCQIKLIQNEKNSGMKISATIKTPKNTNGVIKNKHMRSVLYCFYNIHSYETYTVFLEIDLL